jgi:hypothetical protein
MQLSNEELSHVLSIVSPTGVNYQAGRICKLLAKGPARTGVIAQQCSVGNLADCIKKSINPRLLHTGYFISCAKPPRPIVNKFHQPAGDWIWSFYKATQEAANDDAQGSSIADWETELAPTLSSSLETATTGA